MIKNSYPSAIINYLCDSPPIGLTAAESIIKPMGIVDSIYCYSPRRRIQSFFSFCSAVKRANPDLVIILAQSRSTRLSIQRQLIAIRILGIMKVLVSNYQPKIGCVWPSESDRLCIGLRNAGVGFLPGEYSIPHFKDAFTSLKNRFKHAGIDFSNKSYLVFSGGGKTSAQHWPLERYAKVLHSIKANFNINIIAIGNDVELHNYENTFIKSNLKVNCFSNLSIEELFELIRHSIFYIGNDTGPMHVAASLKTPVIAIFSARNALGAWYPDVKKSLIFRENTSCQNCFLEVCIEERHRCMTSIEADDVISKSFQFISDLLLQRSGDEY